jgi:transcriptional regulator with XRE-family HTH domain
MTLGEIIKEYREKNKMTMQDFANRSGLSKALISMLEKNRRPGSEKPLVPTIETYKKVAKAVGLSIGDLIDTSMPTDKFIDVQGLTDDVPEEYRRLHNVLYDLGVSLKYDCYSSDGIVSVITNDGLFRIPKEDMDLLNHYLKQYSDMLLQSLEYICKRSET